MASEPKARKMAYLDSEQIEIGDRVSWWLRLAYRTSTTKRVAREFDVSERQAKRWLAGEPPTSRDLGRMAGAYGWRFVHFVFEGKIGIPATEDIHAKLDRVDRELSELRSDLRGKGRE